MTRLELIAPCETLRQRKPLERLKIIVLSIAGGYSLYQGSGSWKSPGGVVHTEIHERIEIAVESEKVSELLNCFEAFGAGAGEESLYFVRDGVPEFLEVLEVAKCER